MSRNETTSAIIDELLTILAGTTMIAMTLAVPNSMTLLNKPLNRYFKKLDTRRRERELRRITTYMKKRKLVTGTYQHGLSLTNAGKERLKAHNFASLSISTPVKWDHQWRLVLFDVPEEQRNARLLLTAKLRKLGFQLLQQSVWIHPFSCREEVEVICREFGLYKYVTYIETSHIDHEENLHQRFKKEFIQIRK